MTKLLVLAALAAAAPAFAQTGQPYPTDPPPQQGAGQQATPQQGAPQQGGQQQGGTAGTAGTGGTASSAGGGGASGSSSQQVVVNPPEGVPPASSTTVVNPPAHGDVVVAEARERPNPLETVAVDAAYGGVAGLLVGTGLALVDEWDDWERKLMVGAGIGVIVGAGVGVIHAGFDARDSRRVRRVAARDGLGSPDRDPVLAGAGTVLGYAGRF